MNLRVIDELEIAMAPVLFGGGRRLFENLREPAPRFRIEVCGVRVEDIEDPLMRKARYLDKLVDELAKGKTLDKILRR